MYSAGVGGTGKQTGTYLRGSGAGGGGCFSFDGSYKAGCGGGGQGQNTASDAMPGWANGGDPAAPADLTQGSPGLVNIYSLWTE